MVKRQVDDFVVVTRQATMADYVWDRLDDHFLVPIKQQGLMTHFNGVNVEQTQYYVKLSVGTYLQKVFSGHGWLEASKPEPLPILMNSELKYLTALDRAVAPTDASEIAALEKAMNVNYRQIMEEMIWAMVTCQLDVSFPMVKMSQYNAAPAREHYMAPKNILRYLWATIDNGIYFWRWQVVDDLPTGMLPTPRTSKHDFLINDINRFPPDVLYGCVDSDWAADIGHRRSVMGDRH